MIAARAARAATHATLRNTNFYIVKLVRYVTCYNKEMMMMMMMRAVWGALKLPQRGRVESSRHKYLLDEFHNQWIHNNAVHQNATSASLGGMAMASWPPGSAPGWRPKWVASPPARG